MPDMRALLGLMLAASVCAGEPAPIQASPPVDATVAMRDHTARLKAANDLTGFTLMPAGPFLIVGDEPAATLDRHRTGTIAWFTTHLKKLYFPKDPTGITTIWLFRDKASYERHTKRFFGKVPDTPFGYFSTTDGLVMNIATGGGTLCHELVHCYVRANYPGCPDWLNEGLGSLYEQCGERQGRLTGFVNWRLPGLQQAIREKTLPTFAALCADADFYGDAKRTNYAQARYLLLHLQETGQLKDFMIESMRDRDDDPTAWKALVRHLKEPDLVAFQARWEQWVLGLKAP